MGPDLKGKLTHIFAPKTKRKFEGAAVETAGNASNIKGEFSLLYIPLNDIRFFCTIDEKDIFQESNRGPNKIKKCC